MAALTLALALPVPVNSALIIKERRLSFYHTHTLWKVSII